jgi:hypothetical protein
MCPNTYQYIDLTIKVFALIGIIVAARQFVIARRTHLFDVYREAMKLLDEDEVRAARNWVYDIESSLYDREQWVFIKKKPQKPEAALSTMTLEETMSKYEAELTRYTHKQMAERTARAFDRLGLLVREGRIPIDLIARFYVTPILRCWYKLGPYIEAVRVKRYQRGHMWEFENLVFSVVVPNVIKGRGIWKFVKTHEGLEAYKESIEASPVNLLAEIAQPKYRDEDYCPPQKLWQIQSLWSSVLCRR